VQCKNRSYYDFANDPATAILCMLSSRVTGSGKSERGTKREGQALCIVLGLIIWLSAHLS